jgi:hypothetical protein
VALIKCLLCSGTFDDTRQVCPGCGCPVPVQVSDKSSQERCLDGDLLANPGHRLRPPNSELDGFKLICSMFSLVICGAFSLFMCLLLWGMIAGSSSRSSNDDDRKSWPITMAQAFVKERLKSPTSASFPWSFDEYRVSNIGNEWSVSGYVDAINGFNANLRTHWSLRMRDEGDNWRLLSINIRE